MSADLDRLAIQLFRTFARVEYALKVTGRHFGDGAAQANWYQWSEELVDLFEKPPSEPLRQAIDFILAAPPKKQVVEEGALKWVVVKPSAKTKSDEVLQYVRRVRNNLFHGGKFNVGFFDPERSEPLLSHSLTILEEAVRASPEVDSAFHG